MGEGGCFRGRVASDGKPTEPCGTRFPNAHLAAIGTFRVQLRSRRLFQWKSSRRSSRSISRGVGVGRNLHDDLEAEVLLGGAVERLLIADPQRIESAISKF